MFRARNAPDYVCAYIQGSKLRTDDLHHLYDRFPLHDVDLSGQIDS